MPCPLAVDHGARRAGWCSPAATADAIAAAVTIVAALRLPILPTLLIGAVTVSLLPGCGALARRSEAEPADRTCSLKTGESAARQRWLRLAISPSTTSPMPVGCDAEIGELFGGKSAQGVDGGAADFCAAERSEE